MVSENDYQVQITMLEKELADLKALMGKGVYLECIVCKTRDGMLYCAKCYGKELADLKAEHKKLLRKATVLAKDSEDYYKLKQLFRRYRRCIFKPYNPQDIGTKEFYDLDEQVEKAIKE